VPQKVRAQALAFGRSFDEAGDVRDTNSGLGLSAREKARADVRPQRREGVARNLGRRLRQGGQEARLARVGRTDERDVCDHAKLERNEFLLAHASRGVAEHGRGIAMQRGMLRTVAEAAAGADGSDVLHAGGHQVREDDTRVIAPHDGAAGHVDQNVFTVAARHVVATAVAPLWPLESS